MKLPLPPMQVSIVWLEVNIFERFTILPEVFTGIICMGWLYIKLVTMIQHANMYKKQKNL